MKLPFLDVHIVRGKNVVTEAQLKKGEYENNLRNKMVQNLLDKIEHLKGLLR
jgi:hypothetical protein